ncbi:E3 ubiquitin/ISG15 ligase TRIM25-like [Dreissena polymorpha]|uniref:RING-type E3 ubiquitin transferase n=1 Tax=Dreissena polymorpha TaxID=45954 RepID=A0A9D4BIR9_DREPO|nr:E3 ubiquitin/ISG15 ligase TRIM25-like [Dreissena polymorpha]KAH3696294.1 hypothetical protein DPMN_083759 [Dreissena polymorpha]
MASATFENPNSDNVDCSICTERFSNPCLLNCNHIFCETCIHTWIERLSEDDLSSLSGIECPLCRAITQPPNTQLPWRLWASSLPRASVTDLQDRTFPKMPRCDPCKRSSEVALATVSCVECNEYLCLECEKSHKKLKPTSGHKVYTINTEYDIEDCKKLHEYHKLLMCEKHDEREIEFWCEDDGEVFCATCAIVAHRSCSRVLEISNITEIETQSISVSKWRMEVLKTNLNDSVTVYRKYKKAIDKDIDTIQKQVKERKEILLKTIETEISQLLSSSSNRAAEYSGSVERNLSVLEGKIKQLERSITLTEKCSDMEQGEKRKFIVSSRLERLVKDYDRDIEEICNDTKSELSRVRLTVVNSEHDPKCFIGMLEEYTPTRHKDMLVPAFGMDGCAKKMFKVGSFFSSCDFFTDSVSIFSDKKNKRLVKYNNTSRKVVIEMKTKTEPWTVLVLKKMVVVSFPTNKKISVFNENLNLMKSISTTKCCYSFDDLNENNLLVCEETSGLFVVFVTYDLASGETKSKIDTDGDGNKLLTNSHICVENNILYRLTEQKKVIALNLNDKAEVFKYENKELDWPTGIDIDVEGNIYVCGLRSKNIHMLDNDGELIRILDLAQYGFSPTFIKFSRNNEDLILLGDETNPGPFFFKLK